MTNLSQTEWAKQLKNDKDYFLLDVRTPQEVKAGYIPNAINIDIYKGQEFINEIETLNKNKNYYVYCHSGIRSAQACSIMNQLGFKNAYNLLGGFVEWEGEIENKINQ